MNKDRELISMEQGMDMFNSHAHSLNVAIVSRIKGNLSENIIRKSLDLVQSRHPRLKCHIVNSLGSLRFQTEGTQQIPLELIINSDPEFWQTIVINQLNEKIEIEKVLLKAILFKQTENSEHNYLITIIHHAIVDALCGIHLHSEILQYYKNIVLGHDISNIPSLPILPSLEELIANRGEKNPEIPKPNRQSDTLTVDQYVEHQHRQCKLIFEKLYPQVTHKIINSCKREKVTVHGAICAAMMFAVAEEINQKGKDFYFSCRSSVDMRKRLNPPISHENIGMMVSALTSFHRFSDTTSFWPLAREVSQQIQEKLETEEIYNVILNYKKGTEYLLKHPEVNPFSIFVTNIGKVSIPFEYDPFQLEEISYALSTTVMGTVFGVAISTFKDRMNFNFIFAEPLLNQAIVERLIEKTLIHLKSL